MSENCRIDDCRKRELLAALSYIEAKAQVALDGPSKGGQATIALRDIISMCDKAIKDAD